MRLKRIWLWLSGRGVSNRRAVGEQTFNCLVSLADYPVLQRKCDKICLDCLGIKSVSARNLDECTDRVGCIPVHVCAHLKADGRSVCLYCLVKRDFCVRPVAYKVDDEVDDAERASDDGDGQRDDVCR